MRCVFSCLLCCECERLNFVFSEFMRGLGFVVVISMGDEDGWTFRDGSSVEALFSCKSEIFPSHLNSLVVCIKLKMEPKLNQKLNTWNINRNLNRLGTGTEIKIV